MYFIDNTADLRETDRVRAGEPMPPLRDDLTEAHEWLSPPDGWDFARLACGPHFSRQPVTNPDGSAAWTWERVPAEPGTDEDRLNRRLDLLEERLTRSVPECLPLPPRHGLPALTYASRLRLHVGSRLAIRDSGSRPSSGPRAIVPAAPPTDPTRAVSIAYAAKHWFRCSRATLIGRMKLPPVSDGVRAKRYTERSWVFDFPQVVESNRDADADAEPDDAVRRWFQAFIDDGSVDQGRNRRR